MWKNIVERGRTQMAIWRMRIVCWKPKATNTHSEYVILIAFSLQQWLHERAPVLRHTYIVCLVFCCVSLQDSCGNFSNGFVKFRDNRRMK